jgi:molybdopterin converting factor small subunit
MIQKTSIRIFIVFLIFSTTAISFAQETENKMGAWYAYNWSIKFGDSQFGAAGDFQYRVYEVASDFQQLILRGGLTYTPKESGLTLLAGYSYFNSGELGAVDPHNYEHRLYQDILFKQNLWDRVFIGHRIRVEERFVENQDFRTRLRYMLSARIPVNQKTLDKSAIFVVAQNEVFVNGKKNIGDGRSVALFDRNWLAGGMGYSFTDKLRLELTYMRESTETLNKGQLWLTLFQSF